MKQGILVPFDGSDNATQALKLAIELANVLKEKIILLNVQPSFETLHTKLFFGKNQIQEYQEELFNEVIKPAVELLQSQGIEYTTKLRIGEPKTQVLLEAWGGKLDEEACCSTEGVRMIVMGSRGMNAVIGGILGSVSHGVLHQAPCPVTIVPYSC